MDRGGTQYKIKLSNGRVLGPLDLDRVRRLILKNQVVGTEMARVYPSGEWMDVNLLPEIATMFIAHAEGKLADESHGGFLGSRGADNPGATAVLDPLGATAIAQGPTQVLPGAEAASDIPLQTLSDIIPDHEGPLNPPPVPSDGPPDLPGAAGRSPGAEAGSPPGDDGASRTIVTSPNRERPKPVTRPRASASDATATAAPDDDGGSTRVISPEEREAEAREKEEKLELENGKAPVPSTLSKLLNYPSNSPRAISSQETVVFQVSPGGPVRPGKRNRMGKWALVKATFLALVLGGFGYEVFFDEPPASTQETRQLMAPIRPKLPELREDGKLDPELSAKLFNEGLPGYVADNVVGYKKAAEKFRAAARADKTNVKAFAFLASTYLNLIDSSNKDENYFSVISKLIEGSRAKNVDLPETVIADVEFYVTVNKPEAAERRIEEYSRRHNGQTGLEMYYYLALAYYARGSIDRASYFIGQIPDKQAFSPKVFYLRAKIRERQNDDEGALADYERALKMSRLHARSRLAIAELQYRRNSLVTAKGHLDFIARNQVLLSPKEIARADFLHAQLMQAQKKDDVALGDMERAIQLDKDNHEYLLEYYTLRAKAGDSNPSLKQDGKMFFFMSEGEAALRKGNYQAALVHYLQAREANEASPLPLVKIGDMFMRLHDLKNARKNYELATVRAPNNIEVWTKFIDTLIQSYDWASAEKAMKKFRDVKNTASAIDKAAGDMYLRQGQLKTAMEFYRKAMERQVIDPSVYLAYAKALYQAKEYKEAPFFYALALRFDPINTEALIGTAKCIAELEPIDNAITMLRDELVKGSGSKAELLAGIAELYIKKGAWEQAQEYVDQAMAANSDYALPWKLQAQIYMSKDGVLKDAQDRALAAYEGYSARNQSDPSGYLERYRIFVRKTRYSDAEAELDKIFAIYPKYPSLHYYKGILKAIQSNFRDAVAEFKSELANNPNNVATLLQLGRALVDMGSPKEALAQYQKVMELNPKSSDAKQEAGFAHYLMKNYPTAVALYTAALVYDPANPLIHKRLGMAYRDLGDMIHAQQEFRKYLEMEPDAPDKAQFQNLR